MAHVVDFFEGRDRVLDPRYVRLRAGVGLHLAVGRVARGGREEAGHRLNHVVVPGFASRDAFQRELDEYYSELAYTGIGDPTTGLRKVFNHLDSERVASLGEYGFSVDDYRFTLEPHEAPSRGHFFLVSLLPTRDNLGRARKEHVGGLALLAETFDRFSVPRDEFGIVRDRIQQVMRYRPGEPPGNLEAYIVSPRERVAHRAL